MRSSSGSSGLRRKRRSYVIAVFSRDPVQPGAEFGAPLEVGISAPQPIDDLLKQVVAILRHSAVHPANFPNQLPVPVDQIHEVTRPRSLSGCLSL